MYFLIQNSLIPVITKKTPNSQQQKKIIQLSLENRAKVKQSAAFQRMENLELMKDGNQLLMFQEQLLPGTSYLLNQLEDHLLKRIDQLLYSCLKEIQVFSYTSFCLLFAEKVFNVSLSPSNISIVKLQLKRAVACYKCHHSLKCGFHLQ